MHPHLNLPLTYQVLSVFPYVYQELYNALITSAERASKDVIDGEITCAVRDAILDGKAISLGDYIAISGGNIVAVSSSAEEAVISMLASS